MNAFLRFLGKESAEITRTWRLWVIGGVLLFFAVLSPLTAKAIPYLMKYASGGGSGIAITVTRESAGSTPTSSGSRTSARWGRCS